MKKILFAALCLLFVTPCMRAQNIVIPEGYELVDSLVYSPMSAIDTSIHGQSIYAAMPEGVIVSQPDGVHNALSSQLSKNASRQFNGWRIRIFFDNSQTARGDSERTEMRFKGMYPGYATYRTFDNPYFKVTVGNFRTKADASAALRYIKNDFPSAFVVRERFRYPALDSDSYTVDTVKIIRKKVQ